MNGWNEGLLERTMELIHGEIVSKHLSIGLIRRLDTGKLPNRTAKSSDCATPFSERWTLGSRPESIPAAFASECACLIKTNRMNQRLSQLLHLAIARVGSWKDVEQVRVVWPFLVWA
jgi:hypothetical protein